VAGPTNLAPIGLLGGTFDPIHDGHLALARAACRSLRLAELRLVPAAHPWQKGSITDARQRAHMVSLAIAADPCLRLDLCEIERGGESYTVDTLRAARAAVGRDRPLVLVIGADQMERFDTWREWRAILQLAHLAVARRNDAVLVLSCPLQEFYNERWGEPEVLHAAPAGRVVEVEMVPTDASATEIRALLAQPAAPGRDARLREVVPAPVLDYIRAHHLYA